MLKQVLGLTSSEKIKEKVGGVDKVYFKSGVWNNYQLKDIGYVLKMVDSSGYGGDLRQDENGDYYVIDWAHVTAGNASADAARTFLLFSIENKTEMADKYLKLFSQKSGIEIKYIQSWIPIVAATQLEKGVESEKEFLLKWINVAEYQ